MNLFGRIILGCLVISAFQGILAILAIATILLFLWGLFFRTEQTIGLVAIVLLLSALQVHPWLTIGVIGVFTGVVLIVRVKEAHRPRPQPPVALLPPPAAPDR